MRLQTKLGIAISSLTIITSAILTFMLFMTTRSQLRENIRERLRNIASLAALQINGDAHATLVDCNQESGATYQRVKWTLQKIRDHSPNIRFIYTWRLNESGELVFVVDAETDPKEMSHIGDVYHGEDEAVLRQKLAGLKGPLADEEFATDEWGIWLSGYAPFYRSSGKMEGIVGLDMAASDVIAKERSFLRTAFTVFACTIPLALAIGWQLGHKLTSPIKQLTIASERIAEGDLDYRVQLHCSNEIGILSSAFNRMAQKLQEEIVAREREIAERSRAEKMLAELNKELEDTVNKLSEANRDLSDVAYIAAHDLKTPVRAIGSLASMIRTDYKGKLDKEAVNELNMIFTKAERMSELLDGMLQYCRLERVINKCERVDTNEVVKKMIARIAAPPNIEITIENELPVIECEHSHAVLLFEHLIKNAIKFMDKPKGLIKIACVDKNGFWRFSISDNGPGIEERYVSKIFKLFQTLNSRDEFAGAGIGLPIAKKIVELYNGAIWVESQPGIGSTFFFALPKEGVCKEASEQNRSQLAVS